MNCENCLSYDVCDDTDKGTICEAYEEKGTKHYFLTTYYVYYEEDNRKGRITVKAKDKHSARKEFAKKNGTYKGIKKIEEKN